MRRARQGSLTDEPLQASRTVAARLALVRRHRSACGSAKHQHDSSPFFIPHSTDPPQPGQFSVTASIRATPPIPPTPTTFHLETPVSSASITLSVVPPIANLAVTIIVEIEGHVLA